MVTKNTSIHQLLFLLGVLSTVASDENVLGDDEYYNIVPGNPLIKGFHPNNLDFVSCQCFQKSDPNKLPTQNGLINDPEFNRNNLTPEDAFYENYLMETPLVTERRYLAKRFQMYSQRNPAADGYKRGPGFRSWGGKRSFPYEESEATKRSKFASWGGKRNKETASNKRSKFASWGGKRNDGVVSEELPTDLDKRSKFTSWGGKRSDEVLTDDEPVDLDKKSKFTSWGGKRQPEISIDGGLKNILKGVTEDSESQKNKKNQYWRTRFQLFGNNLKKNVPKRPQFQSWGGKRTNQLLGIPFDYFQYFPDRYRLKKILNSGEKRKFSSWGGKRADENMQEEPAPGLKDFWPETNDFKLNPALQNWEGNEKVSRDSYDKIDNIFTMTSPTKESHSTIALEKKSENKREYSKTNFGFPSATGNEAEEKPIR